MTGHLIDNYGVIYLKKHTQYLTMYMCSEVNIFTTEPTNWNFNKTCDFVMTNRCSALVVSFHRWLDALSIECRVILHMCVCPLSLWTRHVCCESVRSCGRRLLYVPDDWSRWQIISYLLQILWPTVEAGYHRRSRNSDSYLQDNQIRFEVPYVRLK